MLSCLLAWLKTNKNNIGTSFFSHLQPFILEVNRFISTFVCNSLMKDQIFLRLYENSNDILSSHVRNFYVGSYENSVFFNSFSYKKIVHVTSFTYYVFNGL